MKRLTLLLLFPLCAAAADLYRLRALSEPEILQVYSSVLLDACHHAAAEWKAASFDPAAGYWGDGASDGNGGIRSIASMVLANGALLKYADGLGGDDRQDLRTKAIAALRYVTVTHRSGSQRCVDGKPWGATPDFGRGSWQSGMWTGTFACGAWLIWDELSTELQQDIQRVIAAENDILAARNPPHGLGSDTKAEENAWEVPSLVLGEVMFPRHPHAAAWHEAALRYLMNTLCTADDLHDTRLVDGRPVNQWVGGANLQPDFTLENHGIFHPAYVGCSCYFMTQSAMYYTRAGRPVPQAATHHLMDTWRMFQTILLPSGEPVYPQGMDWELHGISFGNLFAALATRAHDPVAARLEQTSLQYIRAWQVARQGDLAVAGSRLGFVRHAICAEQAAYAFMAHKVFGPATREAPPPVGGQGQGTWDYRPLDFLVHRTGQKLVSFSWKNRIMGVLVPIGEGHDGNPAFTVPIQNGLVGSFLPAVRGAPQPTVGEHTRTITPDGFETAGTLLLPGGQLQQTLKVSSIGRQVVVYQDRVTALADGSVTGERGVPFGIENDEITGDVRIVSGQDGQQRFDAQSPRPPWAVPGSWVNVDGRLGVALVAGAGLTYVQAAGYLPGMAVRADTLYGAYSDRLRQFKAGEEVAHRVVVYCLEIGPAETAALAASCRVEEKSGGHVLHFRSPGGGEVEVPLL